MWAAIFLAFPTTFSAARCTATPPTGEAARAVGVAAVGGDGGVAVEDLDVVGVHAEGVGGDLGPRGDVALAVRGGAGDDLDLARGAHPHGRRLPAAALQADAGGDLRGREAAALGEVADPDAELD